MNANDSRALHSDHALEAAYLKKFERHEHDVRDRERRRIASLVGPGHCDHLAHDAPLGSDSRLDNTGFCPGALL